MPESHGAGGCQAVSEEWCEPRRGLFWQLIAKLQETQCKPQLCAASYCLEATALGCCVAAGLLHVTALARALLLKTALLGFLASACNCQLSNFAVEGWLTALLGQLASVLPWYY